MWAYKGGSMSGRNINKEIKVGDVVGTMDGNFLEELGEVVYMDNREACIRDSYKGLDRKSVV